ncbi:MAG: hypothetical protein K8R90_00510 [Candidatus Cloacimonetes bacterium]|nr:hypothetical protein [Candidatus Cloacimonadota bacterium]
MKRLLCLALLLLTLAACAPRLDSPAKLAESLHKALRTDRHKAFAACCLREADITFLDNKIRVSRSDNPDDYAPLSDLSPDLPDMFSLMFGAIRAEVGSINWKNVELMGFDEGEEVLSAWVPPGVRLLDSLTLNLSDGQQNISLRFYDVVRTQRGWLVSNTLYRLQVESP